MDATSMAATQPRSHTGVLILGAVTAGAAVGAAIHAWLMRKQHLASNGQEGNNSCTTNSQDLERLLQEEQHKRQEAESHAADLQQRLQALSSKASRAATPVSPPPAHSNTSTQPPQPSASTLAAPLLPVRPIGYLHSCFTTRNGTPRQPLLVPTARSRLSLLPDVPDASLEGLNQWSHVWVLYWFHENTESQTKTPQGSLLAVKGKVKVPRLNGEKVGLFATRTPHRPVPIGLSVAQVISVSGRTIVLGGADIVDGSPVLDIKPYVPFCDSVPCAVAPPYVKAEAEEEPLAVGGVIVTPVGLQQLTNCWKRNSNRSLYQSAEEYVAFVTEVLSRDIRSTRQRMDMGAAAQQRNSASLASAAAVAQTLSSSQPPPAAHPIQGSSAHESTSAHSRAETPDGALDGHSATNARGSTDLQGTGVFHVVLEGIDVSYDLGDERVQNAVIIGGASLTTALALQHKHKHKHKLSV